MPRQHKIPFLALLLLSFLLNDCEAQAVDKDEVVWTTQSGWNDMKTCAKCKFDYLFCNWPGNLQGDIGCSTNACMCRASTLGQTLKKVSDSVLSACSNYDDQRDATSFLIAYCSDKGYTSIGSAVIASSTDGFRVRSFLEIIITTPNFELGDDMVSSGDFWSGYAKPAVTCSTSLTVLTNC
uniref:Extracellular membrane protein CFEM domain-containing protein n=1 Tax=Bionectria ochroleuca TaxID=29856 RepID=A0A0B7KEP4_BIOOC